MTGRLRDADVMFHAFIIYAMTADCLGALTPARGVNDEMWARRQRYRQAAAALARVLEAREARHAGRAVLMPRLARHLGLVESV